MSFSQEYSDLFSQTYSSLEKEKYVEKIALMPQWTKRLFGPSSRQMGKMQKKIDNMGLKDITPEQVFKERPTGNTDRTAIFGFGNTDRIMNEHLAERFKRMSAANPEGRIPQGFTGGQMLAGGAGGAAVLGGVDHAMSAPGNSMFSKTVAGMQPQPQMGGQAPQQMAQPQPQQDPRIQQQRQMMLQRMMQQRQMQQQASQRGYYG